MKKHISEHDAQVTIKLANLILEKSNLVEQFEEIFEQIEEDLIESHGEDGVKGNGIIYSKYKAIDDGVFSTHLDTNLTQSKKDYLLSLTDGSLEFSIARKDNFVNSVTISLLIPKSVHSIDGDKFRFTIKLVTSLNASTIYSIDAYELDIEKEEFYQFVSMYTLKHE